MTQLNELEDQLSLALDAITDASSTAASLAVSLNLRRSLLELADELRRARRMVTTLKAKAT